MIHKYRAWDKKAKEMISLVGWRLYNLDQYQLFTLDGFRICNIEDVEFLQFTGLTDKNGKEDYDGSIWEVLYRGEIHKFLHRQVMSWEGYVFEFKCLTGDISSVHANVDEEGIIVGNKDENPKLLKEKGTYNEDNR